MMKRYLYILLLLTLAACDDDKDYLISLSEEQQALIGKAVNFNATLADEFKQPTRTTYTDTGVFNEDDMMRIYREYASKDGGWDADASYRTYYFHTKYATGTEINLGTDWRVYAGRKGYNSVADALHGKGSFTQTTQDSITWEDGRTVRFRAWSRSNYAGSFRSCNKTYYANENYYRSNYYPDFCISDWVTVSGPTKQIPLNMRHVCSRIAFKFRETSSNELWRVEIADKVEDYMRPDNSDTNEHDGSEDEACKTAAKAKEELDLVMAAYNRMCMPAGVDIEKSELYAMTKSCWDTITASSLKILEDLGDTPERFYHFATNTPDSVKENVQRAIFTNAYSPYYCYLLTIPYDMSNGPESGNVITLPACTRFRVYMRDVNNGDGNNTSGYEGTYHIFSLQDILTKDKDGNDIRMFPDGLAMLPGYSYKFEVGYRYKNLTITAIDNFSWDEQDWGESKLEADVQTQPQPTNADYGWWKDAIKKAIPTTSGGDFKPEFHIKTQQEFIEFINLVNGTATTKTSGLYSAKRNKVNKEHEGKPDDQYNWWYTSVSANRRDTTWITTADAIKEGYLFYESYHPANGPVAAYSVEDYIQDAYPFYDETLNRRYTVYLDADLDLYDWELPSIGDGNDDKKTPFMGYFDGYCKGEEDVAEKVHTLSNVNMKDEYLFKYIDGAAIRNLKINSTHKVSLVKEGTNTCYIVGIDLRAHSTRNSIAEKLTSNENNNPSYVVGCIHVGDATGALVGASSNLYMYGCMQAAEGISYKDTDVNQVGALVGRHLRYSTESTWKFLTPQKRYNFDKGGKVDTPSWGRFMCNYFDTELSPGTWAVGDLSWSENSTTVRLSTSNDYSPLEYIRGRQSSILKAKNDNLLKGETTFDMLQNYYQRMAYYGLAPWKAMNYGIYRFNQTGIGITHKCKVHYENNSTGYVHRYPELVSDAPTSAQYANVLEQNN